jgi:TPP-dependent pyruvate/acetoin dehydrogenase alpha subunit
MLIIRFAEEKISENVESGVIKCPCHLGIGQEAIGTAVSMLMRKSDRAFGAHRSHSHYLAINEDTYSLFAETLGRYDGCSNGMGGSMHVIDTKNGFMGSVPIVGTTIPIATGAGLAAKMDNNQDIAISYFGDGACEEGVFHESLNMASVMNLPVLYVCENNLFSSHMHITQRQPDSSTARFAKSHKIKNLSVDGNDVVSLYKVLKNELKIVRETNRPLFLEAYTYRWKGHVGHRDDIDVGVKRTDDLIAWKKRDPIKRLENSLLTNNILDNRTLKSLHDKVKNKIEIDWNKALIADFPDPNFLTKPVYSK